MKLIFLILTLIQVSFSVGHDEYFTHNRHRLFTIPSSSRLSSFTNTEAHPIVFKNIKLSPHDFVSSSIHDIGRSERSSEEDTEMKTHIESVLSDALAQQPNDSVNENILDFFNVVNTNPRYMFMLPDHQPIIFRRNDMSKAVYPNITTQLKTIKFLEELNKTDEEFRIETSTVKNLEFSELVNEFDDSENVVLQNVKTEKTFIKMMQDINDHPESFTVNPKNAFNLTEFKIKELRKPYIAHFSTSARPFSATVTSSPINDESIFSSNPETKYFQITKQSGPRTHQNFPSIAKEAHYIQSDSFSSEWDALGLKGWSGGLKPENNHDKFKYLGNRPIQSSSLAIESSALEHQNERLPKKQSNQSKDILRSHNWDWNPFKTDKKSTKKKNSKVLASHVSDELLEYPDRISEQLSVLLAEERLRISKETGFKSVQEPKFMITNSRDLHRDEDVFIARANNPFGHSTKWRYGNSTIDQSEREGRSKRGVVQLYSMIKCATGCDPIIYKGYGCYCGFLGSGPRLDGIDRCCAIHDRCYSNSGCPMFLEYFVPYLWKCYRGRPLCAVEHGEWGGPRSCASRLCECDRVLAHCLRRYYCPQKRAVCRSSPFRLLQNYIMEF